MILRRTVLSTALLSACVPTYGGIDDGFAAAAAGAKNEPGSGTADATCHDDAKNGTETDVDCGGSCDPCATGDACERGPDCTSGVCTNGKCVEPSCNDVIKNQDETDIDCGGSCEPCANGLACRKPTDCIGGECTDAKCQPGSCADGVKNGNETDIDCGSICSKCADGARCSDGDDCVSDVCTGGVCMAPSCNDDTQNGDETGEDCGGACEAKCDSGDGCSSGDDCTSRVCSNKICRAPSCTDTVANGGEPAPDCGGPCATKCANGAVCGQDSDCASLVCNGTCAAPTCSDGTTNGDESDLDCGGSCVAEGRACGIGQACAGPRDCAEGVCNDTCLDHTCSDGVKNGDESDEDCGGSCVAEGKTCELGKQCDETADCTAGICDGGYCQLAGCTNAIQDGNETDVNCGGGDCAPCTEYRMCLVNSDCRSGVCGDDTVARTCSLAACDDGVTNGTESDVDCGGACDQKCETDQLCDSASDCTNGVCVYISALVGSQCAAPTCTDGVTNGTETDEDCGGSDCRASYKCADGLRCATNADCQSGKCDTTTDQCAAPSCPDGVQNQSETDVDCGGSDCALKCAVDEACLMHSDCSSGFCRPTSNRCATPSCSDGYQNQDEADVDCGGPCGATCEEGKSCEDDLDCATGLCSTTCQASGFSVQYYPMLKGDASPGIQPSFRVLNSSGSSVSVAELTIRYYFTNEVTAQTFQCYYAAVNGGTDIRDLVTHDLVAGSGTNYYLEIRFGSGSGTLPISGRLDVNTGLNRSNYWEDYTQSNDYSYDGSRSSYSDAPRVTLYRNGARVWGTVDPTF